MNKRVSGIVGLEVEVVFNEQEGHPSLLVCMTSGSEFTSHYAVSALISLANLC